MKKNSKIIFVSLFLISLSIFNLFNLIAAEPWNILQNEPTITIGFHPEEKGHNETLKTVFIEELKRITRLNIKPYFSTSNNDLIEKVKNKGVDFAFLSGFAYAIASEKDEVIPLVRAIYSETEAYRGAIIVLKDSKINSIKDLKGKRIAFVEKGSTSGYLLPQVTLLKSGIDPSKYFSKILFAGKHDLAVKMLVNGEVDASACWIDEKDDKRGAWTQYLDKEKAKLIIPIFVTSKVPHNSFCVRNEFYKNNRKISAKLLAGLLSYTNKPDESNLPRQLFNIDYFVPSKPEDYNYIKSLREYLKKVE